MSFPKHFSASMVEDWVRCPLCWYLKHDKTKIGIEKETSGRLFFGRCFSEALSEIHSSYDLNKSKSKFNTAVQRHKDHNLNVTPGLEFGLALLDEYSEKGVFKGVPEFKFKVQIKDLPLPVLGYMDLLLENSRNTYGLVEFKTSSSKWDQERVDKEIQGILYWCSFYVLFGKLPEFTYVIFRTDERRVDFFKANYPKEICIQTIELLRRVFLEMELAHSENVFPGFCQIHKEKKERVLVNHPKLIL